MKKSNKFRRHLIKDRYDIPNYQPQTIETAIKNVSKILNLASTITVEEFKSLLPQQMIFRAQAHNLSAGEYLYRARLLEVSDWRITDNWTEADYWETPATLVNEWGRLNEPGESIFYATNDVRQSFKEIRYQADPNRNHGVVVAAFRVAEPFSAPRIGGVGNTISVDNIYSNMIDKIFSLPAEEYGKNVYKLSNFISDYFIVEQDPYDGFSFSSVQAPNSGSFNLALKPVSAHNHLKFEGSMVVPNYGESIDGNITTEIVRNANLEIGSPELLKDWIFEKFKICYK